MDPAESIRYLDELLADHASALAKLRQAQLGPEGQKLLSRMRSMANAAEPRTPERQPASSGDSKPAQDLSSEPGNGAPPAYATHFSSTAYSIPDHLADKPASTETISQTASVSLPCYGCGSTQATCCCPSEAASPATSLPASPFFAVPPRVDGGVADVKKGDFLNQILQSSCRGSPSKILLVSQCLRTELVLHDDQVNMRSLTRTFNAAFRKEATERNEGVEMRAKMCSIEENDAVILDRMIALTAARNSNRGQPQKQASFSRPPNS